MFDGVFDVFAEVLSFFYDLVPNYAIAIALLTLLVMVITTPFTLKGTRSMIQMQRLQPEMRKLQLQVQGRPPEAQRRADGVLQGEQPQPARRLPPAAPADADLHHPLQRHPGA